MSKNIVLAILNEENCEIVESVLIKRLLTKEEISQVSGGNNYGQCGSSNPGHSMSGGTYDQVGGGYTQSGGTYKMHCDAPL